MRGGFHEAIELTECRLPCRTAPAASRVRRFRSAKQASSVGTDRGGKRRSMRSITCARGSSRRRRFAVSVVDVDGRVSRPALSISTTRLSRCSHMRQPTARFELRSGATGPSHCARHCTGIIGTPSAGFWRGLPRRCETANPHMHLFEATLAWSAVDDDPAWASMADGIAQLCLGKFIDAETGALRECFCQRLVAGGWHCGTPLRARPPLRMGFSAG